MMMNNLFNSIFITGGRLSTGSPDSDKGKIRTGNDWLSLAAPSGEQNRLVYAPSGKPLTLKKNDVLAHEGEGIVYKPAINPNYLIKICKDETLKKPSKREAFRLRLAAMLALEDCRNADFLSWPQMPVFNSGGQAISFVMPKSAGRTLRALYAPSQIKKDFFPAGTGCR